MNSQAILSDAEPGLYCPGEVALPSQLPACTAAELLASISDCVFVLDRDWRFTHVNPAAEREIARGKALVGVTFWDAFPDAIGTEFETNYRRAMDERVSVSFEAYYEALSGWYEVRALPLSSGSIGVLFQQTSERRQREAQLANIFGQALVGIAQYDGNGRVRMANQRFCEILGRRVAEIEGLSVADYTHPDDLAWNLPLLSDHKRRAEPFHIEKRYVRPDGSIAWCKVSVSFVTDSKGVVESTIVVAEDITEQRKAEAARAESERLYRSVLEASADCIKILDLDGRIEVMNRPGLCAMELGSIEDIRGLEWIRLWPEQSRSTVIAALKKARGGQTERFSAFCPTGAQTPKWWDVVVSPMCDDGGQVTRILAISRDITLQRTAAARLKWSSEHDGLTDLPNRRAFENHLQGAIIRAMQTDRQVGLLLLDLDHFKHINDTLGHPAGDHLLTVFSQRLRESVRENDLVARLGGDEFAIVLEDVDADFDMVELGQSILSRLQEPVNFEGRVCGAGASIGGAVFPTDATTANELLKHADIALYALKESGRGGTRLFQQKMREDAQLVSSQLALARSSLTLDSVEPHYQQKIDITSGRIAGFEALLRWRHGTRGIQLPDTVAEAFKDYELASRIGDLMQRRVFRDMRGWLDQGLQFGFVAINAAPVEFLRDDFAERLMARMEEYQIPPHLLEVEVTEHAFLERSSDFVGRALRELSRAGVKIALDDFGTGYSSLSHLRDYPVDVVKIDRSFIERIMVDPEVRAIVRAVIDLARSLDLEVVAEGVETKDQSELLGELGCRMIQGFWFGRAVEANEIPTLLKRDCNSQTAASHLFAGRVRKRA